MDIRLQHISANAKQLPTLCVDCAQGKYQLTFRYPAGGKIYYFPPMLKDDIIAAWLLDSFESREISNVFSTVVSRLMPDYIQKDEVRNFIRQRTKKPVHSK